MSRKHRSESKRQCPQKPQKDKIIAYLFRCHKRHLIEKGVIQDPNTRPFYYRFLWSLGSVSGMVYADDRSTARAIIKRDLGIPKKQRLPVGIEITKEANIDE